MCTGTEYSLVFCCLNIFMRTFIPNNMIWKLKKKKAVNAVNTHLIYLWSLLEWNVFIYNLFAFTIWIITYYARKKNTNSKLYRINVVHYFQIYAPKNSKQSRPWQFWKLQDKVFFFHCLFAICCVHLIFCLILICLYCKYNQANFVNQNYWILTEEYAGYK